MRLQALSLSLVSALLTIAPAVCHADVPPAKQAEAAREARSKIIHAEGEFNAAQKLVEAAHLLATEPLTMQLRYLQTLTEIGVEKNTTIVFPLPVDILSLMRNALPAGLPTSATPSATVDAKQP